MRHVLSRVTCPHCGSSVERRPFCGECGQAIDSVPTPLPATPRRPWGGVRDVRSSLGMLLSRSRRRGIVSIAGAGLILASVALLASEPGIALVIVAGAIATTVVALFRAVDLFEDEPARGIAAAALGGLIAGLIVALLSDILVDQLWLDGATFNVGAGGFGGRFAEAAGRPPTSLVLLAGAGIPVLGAALTMLGPLLLRRLPAYRNEVLDGLTLGGGAGAGFAVAGAAVYFFPLITGDDTAGSTVSEWTATILGVSVVRPLIVTLSASLLGGALWQYGLSRRVRDTLRYAVPGALGVVVFTIVDLLIQPSGTTIELGWLVLSLAMLTLATRGDLAAALAKDRAAFGPGTGRIRCPSCHSITPQGTFCARCGAPLQSASATGPAAVARDPSASR